MWYIITNYRCKVMSKPWICHTSYMLTSGLESSLPQFTAAIPNITTCTNDDTTLALRPYVVSPKIVPNLCTPETTTSVWPRGAQSGRPWQELIERSHSPSRGDGMHHRSPRSDPLHKQGTSGWPGWAPSKLFEPGQTGVDPGKLNERTL